MTAREGMRRRFILEYIKGHSGADALAEDFHDQWVERFGTAGRKMKLWGAQPVRPAMALLAKMAREGALERVRVGIGDSDCAMGFPRWVWSYRLPVSQ